MALTQLCTFQQMELNSANAGCGMAPPVFARFLATAEETVLQQVTAKCMRSRADVFANELPPVQQQQGFSATQLRPLLSPLDRVPSSNALSISSLFSTPTMNTGAAADDDAISRALDRIRLHARS